MPTIEVSLNDLSRLVGKKFTLKDLEGALEYVKGEVEGADGDRIKIEIADTNRPDLWSTEGIARELRARYTEDRGLPTYKIRKSGLKVIVDKNLSGIRPKTVCAVVKNIKFTEESLFQLIQLQEKVCETFGRKRKEIAIGVYDYQRIVPPIRYRAFAPREIKFAPLEFEEEMYLDEILSKHPKGLEYGYLLSKAKRYPIFIDAKDNVLSMPPIINSNYTGKVTTHTKDVFIECSGFDVEKLMPALNIMATALADRGGSIESVEVVYPDGKTITTPNLKPNEIMIDPKNVNSLLGVEFSKKEIIKLLELSRYRVKPVGSKFNVFYPAYRQDIMHEVDVIEDIAISYGYNRFEPSPPSVCSKGSLTEANRFSYMIIEIMLGLGSQEVMNYTLTNKDVLLTRMNLNEGKAIEIDNPVSSRWSVFRTWLLPGLLEFLGANTNREYPQNIFEVGEVVVYDAKAETRSKNPVHLAWAKAEKRSDFTHAKQSVDFFLRNLGLPYETKEYDHPSFIPGRCASIATKGRNIGFLGEIHPKVLENFGIEMPVCAFEIDISLLRELIS